MIDPVSSTPFPTATSSQAPADANAGDVQQFDQAMSAGTAGVSSTTDTASWDDLQVQFENLIVTVGMSVMDGPQKRLKESMEE